MVEVQTRICENKRYLFCILSPPAFHYLEQYFFLNLKYFFLKLEIFLSKLEIFLSKLEKFFLSLKYFFLNLKYLFLNLTYFFLKLDIFLFKTWNFGFAFFHLSISNNICSQFEPKLETQNNKVVNCLKTLTTYIWETYQHVLEIYPHILETYWNM